MREELCCSLCPLAGLLARAEALTEGAARDFFAQAALGLETLEEQSFAEGWAAACRGLAALAPEERRALEEPGLSLGRSELSDQLAALDRSLAALDKAAEALRARLPEQRRLSLALSAAAGVFLCLLIL